MGKRYVPLDQSIKIRSYSIKQINLHVWRKKRKIAPIGCASFEHLN